MPNEKKQEKETNDLIDSYLDKILKSFFNLDDLPEGNEKCSTKKKS